MLYPTKNTDVQQNAHSHSWTNNYKTHNNVEKAAFEANTLEPRGLWEPQQPLILSL